jgi:hypothetical protein
VDDAAVGELPGEGLGHIRRTVVGEHAPDLDPVRGEVDQGTPEERRRGLTALVGELLGLGEPGVIIDGDVDDPPAGTPSPHRSAEPLAHVAGILPSFLVS